MNQSKKPEFHPLQILKIAMFLAVVNREAPHRTFKVPSMELTFTYTHVDHDEVSNTLECWSVMILSLAVLLGPYNDGGIQKATELTN